MVSIMTADLLEIDWTFKTPIVMIPLLAFESLVGVTVLGTTPRDARR